MPPMQALPSYGVVPETPRSEGQFHPVASCPRETTTIRYRTPSLCPSCRTLLRDCRNLKEEIHIVKRIVPEERIQDLSVVSKSVLRGVGRFLCVGAHTRM